MIPAMVLAAGLGSRLRPLTNERPKALVPIGDRPALAHVLERLGTAGMGPVVVNAHHHAEELVRFVEAWPAARASVESELLGTAGGLARAAPWLGDGKVLVYNVDCAAAVDVGGLARGCDGHAAAALLVRVRPAGEGSVGLDATGRVVRLRRIAVGAETRGADFLGVHVLGQALRARLPAVGCLVGDVYIPALQAGAELRAVVHEGTWFDVGTLADYLAANLAWLEERGVPAWTGAGAQVAPGVSLRSCVVGAGASVHGQGVLERCVVWPGAVARAPLADAVVTSAGFARC